MPADDDMHDAAPDDDEHDDPDGMHSDTDTDSDASSSSQSQSLDVDDDLMDTIMTLERTWDASTHRDYATGARLIDALHRAKLRERCKTAREAYAARFALNEQQWRLWIRDALEDKSTATKAERYARADALFERAIADVGSASVELWMGRLRLGLELGLDDNERRAAYELAVNGPGMNYADGHKIWAAYRAFETSRADAMDGTRGRVKALFVRQLALAHGDITGTMEAARAWATESGDEAAVGEFDAAYAAGCAAKDLRAPYEEQTVLSDEKVPTGDTLRAYKRYIEFEIAQGAPARAEHLYERAFLIFPYVGELWREYLVFARNGSDEHRAMMLTRALKMCPSSVALWTYALDRHRSPSLEDAALEARFRDSKDTAIVLIAIIDRYFWQSEVLDINRVLELTKRGLEHMRSLFSANTSAADGIDVLRRFLVPSTLKRLTGAHEDLWVPVRDFFAAIAEDVPFKTAAEFVIARAEFEATEGTKADVLKIFDKASQRGVEPVGVSKKTVDDATRVRLGESIVLQAKLRYLALVDAKAYAKTYEEKTNFAQQTREVDFDAACERLDASAAAKARMHKADKSTRKRTTGGDTTKPSRKRARREDDGGEADTKLKDMDHDARVKALFPNRDERTVFVKNLSWDVTDAELVEFFDGKGGDVNARIVKDKATGRPRGFAYVDFSEDAAVTAAIMRSGEKLKGRAIDVAKSRPPSTKDGIRGGHGRVRGPAGDTGRGGRGGRGGLGLMPRAVAAAPQQSAGKTNADFRAMLFVKSKEGGT